MTSGRPTHMHAWNVCHPAAMHHPSMQLLPCTMPDQRCHAQSQHAAAAMHQARSSNAVPWVLYACMISSRWPVHVHTAGVMHITMYPPMQPPMQARADMHGSPHCRHACAYQTCTDALNDVHAVRRAPMRQGMLSLRQGMCSMQQACRLQLVVWSGPVPEQMDISRNESQRSRASL